MILLIRTFHLLKNSYKSDSFEKCIKDIYMDVIWFQISSRDEKH